MFLLKKKSEMESVQNLLPGLLKTVTLGYDGKGQHLIKSLKNLTQLILIILKVIFWKN